MKKISTILCTLALLFGVVGGVKATKQSLEFQTPWYCNANWSGNTFTWATGGGIDASYTFMEAIDIKGDLSSWETLHLNAQSFTNSKEEKIQVVFKSGDTNAGPTKEFLVSPDENGDITIDLAAVTAAGEWGSCDITHIYDLTIWGLERTDETKSASVVITDAYLEKPDPLTRDVYTLGSPITFEEAKASSDPFVLVSEGKVFCLSGGDITYKDVSEINYCAWTIKFEADEDNANHYYMRIYDSSDNAKGYVNASVWSHTWLSGVDKTGKKGEEQDGALWTIELLPSGKYAIRNVGDVEGSYGEDHKSQGYLAITTSGYWANHVTHYNTSGEWQFYTLAITQLPANDHLFFGWDDLIVTSAENVTKDDKTHLVVDKRDYAPYWAETAKWNLGSFDASNYRYLVFYAKRNVCKYGNEDNETGGTLFIKDANGVTFRQDDLVKYTNSEKVEKNYPEDHIGKLWMNRWNEQRATVLDLQWLANTDKYGDGSECKVLDITKIKEIGVAGTFTIGGIFFTNTQPLYSAGDYTRTFDSFDKYGTICLPFSAVCCGAQLYEIVGKSSDGIALAEYEGVMEAGKPYFYKSLEAIKQDNGLVNETKVYFFKAGYEQVNAPVENNGLIGTFSEITAPEGSDKYVLSSNKLYDLEGATSVKVGANKAYVDASKISNVAGVRAAFISFFEDETGINTVQENPIVKSGAIFNLAGQRVNKAQKGIFIINGKKVVR